MPKPVLVHIDQELNHKAKMYAAQQGVSLKAVYNLALQSLLGEAHNPAAQEMAKQLHTTLAALRDQYNAADPELVQRNAKPRFYRATLDAPAVQELAQHLSSLTWSEAEQYKRNLEPAEQCMLQHITPSYDTLPEKE